MPTAVSTLVQRTRRYVRDWPDKDVLLASMTSATSSASLALGDTTVSWKAGDVIEIDSETMIVRAFATPVLTVKRAAYGSSAASHATSASVLLNPRFYAVEYVDALADGIDAAFPWVYKLVTDTSLSVAASKLEYTVPTGTNSAPIPYIYDLELKESGDTQYRRARRWYTIRDAAPVIRFKDYPPSGASIRLSGAEMFTRLADTSSLDAQWPVNLEYPLVEYAGSFLLASAEANQPSKGEESNYDRGQIRRPGYAGGASNLAYQRFVRRVANSGYPPLPRRQIRL